MMLAKGSNVYSVPAGLSDTEAAPLFCPGVTAYGAVSKAELLPGSSVGVFGVGGVGHVVIQLALLAGADVVTFTNNPLHRDLARELGAAVDEQYQPGEETSVPEGVVDCAIVFAPSDYVVAAALRAVKPGGRVVLGVSQNIRRFPFGDGKSVIGSVLANQAETRELLALAASGSVRISQESFPMREANQVLTLLKQGKIRARAVLVP
jgi:propanol-preferring alcohol dehydrogenase